MTDDERTEETEETEDENGSSNGHSGTRTAVRAAAIAAASGATALAAKKAFSHTGSRSSDKERPERDDGDSSPTSVVGSAISSAWDSARQSLGPMLEEAAGQAGEYVARNSPELVRDTLVPRFIKGFEKAQKSASDD